MEENKILQARSQQRFVQDCVIARMGAGTGVLCWGKVEIETLSRLWKEMQDG